MSEINTGRIRDLANNQTIFDLQVALALKVGTVSWTDLDKIEILKKTIEETMKRVEKAEKAYDLNTAGELKYGIGEDLSKELEKLKLEVIKKVNNLFSNFPSQD